MVGVHPPHFIPELPVIHFVLQKIPLLNNCIEKCKKKRMIFDVQNEPRMKSACWAWEFFLQFYFHTVFTDRSGHHPFKLAEERTLFIYGSFATKKGEIWRSHLNRLSEGMFDTGLVKKWVNLDWDSVSQERRQKADEKEKAFLWAGPDGPKPFQLYHFKGGFSLLVAGLGVAGLVFGLEKVWGKIKKVVEKRKKEKESKRKNDGIQLHVEEFSVHPPLATKLMKLSRIELANNA